MSATEILEIIRAFFQAILNVLKALGINFGDETTATNAAPANTSTDANP